VSVARVEQHADVDVLVRARVAEAGGDDAVVGGAERARQVFEAQAVAGGALLVDAQAHLGGAELEVVLGAVHTRDAAQVRDHLARDRFAPCPVVALDAHLHGRADRGPVLPGLHAQVDDPLRVLLAVGLEAVLHAEEHPLRLPAVLVGGLDHEERDGEVGTGARVVVGIDARPDGGREVDDVVAHEGRDLALEPEHHGVGLLEARVRSGVEQHVEGVELAGEELHGQVGGGPVGEEDQPRE
jgi:hypothetical protein